MIRAVLDSNILVSALIKPEGKPAQIVMFARNDRFILLLNEAIFAEVDRVLYRKHIQKRYHSTDQEIREFLVTLRNIAINISAQQIENMIPQDPPDNIILACAVEGDADYLVSGNLHFLNLKQHRRVKMVTPAQFLEILKAIQSSTTTGE